MATVIQETFTVRDGPQQWQTTEVTTRQSTAWPVHWSGVWVGSLASFGAVLVFGLIGIALGAHLLGPEHRVVDLRRMAIGTLIFSVCAAFFAFVIGGWVSGKIAGIVRSETGMLHGAIVWLIATPFLVAFAAFGAGGYFGGWHAGLAGSPTWAAPAGLPFERPEPLGATATDAERAQYATALTEYRDRVRQWREDTPRATRNSALGALTALLLGLVGSVLGGWLASGEPMSWSYYKTRPVGTTV